LRQNKFCGVDRIIDANINRAKEGLRVCEEVARFILNNRSLTENFKKIRHEIDACIVVLSDRLGLIKERESLNDVGQEIYANELKRKSTKDIFFANIQRVKESIRVLEEFSKLKNTAVSVRFKRIRYGVYEIEKKAAKKLMSL